ncbi:hypothetical protein RJT34_17593 [Clitoria ternatea]|uniref:Uncharacterized protein n=1 Tax=Clitoria ternatea TaxID=43366 RepID=A0AAN9J980_CLITE
MTSSRRLPAIADLREPTQTRMDILRDLHRLRSREPRLLTKPTNQIWLLSLRPRCLTPPAPDRGHHAPPSTRRPCCNRELSKGKNKHMGTVPIRA